MLTELWLGVRLCPDTPAILPGGVALLDPEVRTGPKVRRGPEVSRGPQQILNRAFKKVPELQDLAGLWAAHAGVLLRDRPSRLLSKENHPQEAGLQDLFGSAVLFCWAENAADCFQSGGSRGARRGGRRRRSAGWRDPVHY